MMVSDSPYIPPIECAKEVFSSIEELTGATLEEISKYSFLKVVLMVHPDIRAVVLGKDRVYYEVGTTAANSIAISAHGNPESLELLLTISASNIWNGQPIPEPFRPICCSILSRKSPGARRSGPASGQNFGRFFVAVWTAEYLANAYLIPRTRSDGMEPDSAADMVSEALGDRGFELGYTQLRDWLTHKKHKLNRARADLIAHQYNENLLVALGLVRRRTAWTIGPYGPFGPSPIIGRMT